MIKTRTVILSVWYEMTKIFSNFVRFWRLKAFWKAEKKKISGLFTHDIKKIPQHYVKRRQILTLTLTLRRDYHFLRGIIISYDNRGQFEGGGRRSRSGDWYLNVIIQWRAPEGAPRPLCWSFRFSSDFILLNGEKQSSITSIPSIRKFLGLH